MYDARTELHKLIVERGESYGGISSLIGRNPAYIQQFIKRGSPRKLDEEDRRILARYFGVAEEVLGGPTSSHDALPGVVMVPRLSLGAAAGSGFLGHMAFDANWLRDLGVRPERVSIIRVDSDAMAPTLSTGDDIMVDHDDDTARLRGGIYALRLDGILMVKRIAMGACQGRFSLLSDNHHYPNWTDIDPLSMTIVGRLVWVSHRIG